MKILALIIAACMSVQNAMACGNSIKGIQPGNKVLLIEMQPGGIGSSGEKKSSYAADDDGFLVLSLMAAHCNSSVPYPKVKLTKEQEDCAYDAQRNIDYQERISTTYATKKEVASKVMAIQAVIDKCQLDLSKIWLEAHSEVASGDLKCAEGARAVVAKAVARGTEYNKQQLNPRNLTSLNLTSSAKAEFEKTLTSGQAHAEKLSSILSSAPVKIGAFTDWLEDFKQHVEPREYQVISDPSEGFSERSQQSLGMILSTMGAPLPFVSRSRCGPPFPEDMPEKLKYIKWEPRSSAPATRNTKPAVEAGANQ